MAGTVTETRSWLYQPDPAGHPRIAGEKITIDILTDASDGSIPTTDIELAGFVTRVLTNPGSAAPTDNYDLTLGDPDDSSFDVLGGLLVNRDTANTEQIAPVISGGTSALYLNGAHRLGIANAGNAKTTKIIFYMKFS